MEMLTKLHTARCERCNGPISMFRGEWSGADWYHDDTGEKVCPGAPRAWPIEATISDAESSRAADTTVADEIAAGCNCGSIDGGHPGDCAMFDPRSRPGGES